MRNRLLSLVTLFLSLSVATAVSASPPPKAGLPLQQELASGSALVTDQNTGKVLYSRNPDLVVPIASITKLMTAMVVLDSKLPLDEVLPIAISETSEMRGVFSRVRVGSQISRRDMLLLALMSSENRAAASLAQNYPGGKNAFVKAMNAKAHALGMKNTRYVEPTGLSLHNVSTARDLTRLLVASRQYPLLSQWSTTPEKTVAFRHPNYTLGFRNTNHLINNKTWNIQLTKTGFTNEAGHCLVMRTTINRSPVNLVVLDAFGRLAIIAAPADGHVRLPALNLYRRGGSVVGINSLLYGVEACAGFLDAFGKLFDQGRLPLPDGLREVPLEQGVEQYRAVNEGTCEKIILVP
ncbi:TPA: D-alanyl-D-alanine endopeptidase [Pseudomonas aeruginosa]